MPADSPPRAKQFRARGRKRPADRRPATRYGHEVPRIFTPPLRKLTPKTSLGYSVIAFADEQLGITLLPWQKWLLIHMLELRRDNSLRFKTVVVLVARQNGKSTLAQVLALWSLYVYRFALVLGTAQDLDTAEEVWQAAVDLVTETDENDQLVRPELAELLDRVVLVNGKKSLNLRSGERYKVKAANRRAGRGLSGDLILLDELREHQSWDAWGAITKTTMARAHALVLALSNAGDSTSVVLSYLRKMAHRVLGDPDGICAEDEPGGSADELEDEDVAETDEDTLALFEWSAPPGCPVSDRDAWAMANPSLGYTITERTVASAARTDPEWVFRTEVLCQWAATALDGPFPPGAWNSRRDPTSTITPASPVALCVDVAWDRSAAHVGLAGWRADDDPHVEVIASRSGTDWVIPWLIAPERSDQVKAAPVAIQAKGAPVASLVDPMRKAGIEVIDWQGADLGAATGALYDRVCGARRDEDHDQDDKEPAGGRLRHRGQPLLDVAASTTVAKPLGDSWVWDRRHSPADASPLVAVTGALWLLTTHEPDEELPDADIF